MSKPKYLFLANGNKHLDRYESKEMYRLSSFSKIPVEAAQEMGYEVYVGVNAKYARELTCDHSEVKLRNVEIYRNPFNIKEVWKSYKNVRNILKEGGFEVIHCNTPLGGMLGRICGRKAGVKKIIYTAHGFHFYKGAPLLNWLIYYPIERILAHKTDALLTMNQEDYKRARKFHLRKNGNVYYVPGVGMNLEAFENVEVNPKELRETLGVSKEDFLLIVAGDLVKGKNHKTIIRAVAKCSGRVHLLVCGQGIEKENLENLSKELHVEKQIHFLGFRSDIKELLKISDAFVFASYREGLSRAVMEAMASGLPAVVSDIRGNNELICKKGGYLVKPDDADGMAERIMELKNNKGLAEEMGRFNKKYVEKFSDRVVRKQIEEIYRSELS